MKNAKNIQKITTSLFLAATLVLGSVSFAVPGIMPSAFAATENLYVSADNNLFEKSFNGPMVIEIVVNDNDIDDVGISPEPDVTVNGGTLKMVQSSDGNWYAYIAANAMVENANSIFGAAEDDPADGETFGADSTDADAIYSGDDLLVVRQSKINAEAISGSEWPAVQAFSFAEGDVTISYSKGGNPQSITLAYLTDPDDYASLSLDRSSYPPGADVHMTITSLAHNIDPTDEDSWTYNTDANTVTYQLYDENGDTGDDPVIDLDLGLLNFDDSASFVIDTDPNDVLIIGFRNNDDQNRDDDPLNPNYISCNYIRNRSPNSGIFKRYLTIQDTAKSLKDHLVQLCILSLIPHQR